MNKKQVTEWLVDLTNEAGSLLQMPTIYKKDSLNNIRTWYVEIEGNAYRRTAGIMGTDSPVTSEWTLATGKNPTKANATTNEEQAMLEAVALYAKKLGNDYFQTQELAATTFVLKPMLAKVLAKVKMPWASEKIYSQRKLDGMRCVATAGGLFSRTGKPIYSCPHVEKALSPFFAEYPDMILDGELYNHDYYDDFNTLISLCRKQNPTEEEFAEIASKVQYHMYDTMEDLPFIDRFMLMGDRLVDHASNDTPILRLVETKTVISLADSTELYGKYLEAGYEGQILRISDKGYEKGKRPNQLVKRKEFLDHEFEILAIEEGQGNWAGYAKRVLFRLPADWEVAEARGKTVGAGIRGNQEFTMDLLINAEMFVGCYVKVRYGMQLTPDGIPRWPVAIDFFKGKRQD